MITITCIILIIAIMSSSPFSIFYKLVYAQNTPKRTNPRPGVDLGQQILWDKDNLVNGKIPVYIVTNPNSPASQYIDTVKKSIQQISDNLKQKSGNPNAWDFDVRMIPDSYWPKIGDTPPQYRNGFTINLDGDPKSSDCPSSSSGTTYGATYPGKGAGYSRICVANIIKNYPKDIENKLSGVVQHEFGGHGLGLGHSNIPDDPMCSSDNTGGQTSFNFYTCLPNQQNGFGQPLSDPDYAALLKMYGADGFGGSHPALNVGDRYEFGGSIPTYNQTFAHQVASESPTVSNTGCVPYDRSCSTPQFGYTQNTMLNCLSQQTCDLNQISNDLSTSGTCASNDPSACSPSNILSDLAHGAYFIPSNIDLLTGLSSSTAPNLNGTSSTAPNLNGTSSTAPPSSVQNNNSNILPSCQDGSQPDANGNCLPTSLSPENNSNTPSQPPQLSASPLNSLLTQTCPDGSQPDANGNCLQATNQLPSTSMPQTCPDGSTPASDGTCPTPQTQQPITCPDGSPAAADGSCPPPPAQQQTPLSPDQTPTPSPYSWYGSSHELQKSA